MNSPESNQKTVYTVEMSNPIAFHIDRRLLVIPDELDPNHQPISPDFADHSVFRLERVQKVVEQASPLGYYHGVTVLVLNL